MSPAPPADAGARAPAVLSRTVVREPHALPDVLRVVGAPEFSVSGNVASEDVTDAWWFPLAFGGAFLLAGGAVAWLGWNVEPQVPHPASRWVALAFGTMFMLAGVFVVLSTLGGAIRRRRPLPVDWRVDHTWRRTVRHQTGLGHTSGPLEWVRSAVFAAVIAFLYGLIHLPLVWGSEYIQGGISGLGPFPEVSAPRMWLFVVLVFDAILLLVLAVAAREAAKRLRFGRTTLHLWSFPASTGGALDAELRIGRGVRATGPAQCALHCIDEGAHPPDGAPPGATVGIYTETVELDIAGTHVRGLRVAFAIPREPPGTRLGIAPRVYWRLRVRIPTRGPDFLTDHLVPVYAPDRLPSGTPPPLGVIPTDPRHEDTPIPHR